MSRSAENGWAHRKKDSPRPRFPGIPCRCSKRRETRPPFPVLRPMDKSPQYLRMCEHAAEIQQRWRQSHGDFYADAEGTIRCWIQTDSHPPFRMKGGFYIESSDSVIRMARMIWLPRQDQLIEMAQVRGRTYDSVVLDFYNWTKRPYHHRNQLPGRSFPSMESIWMAFVMQRKFHKKWGGTTWVETP
jgi:hypothetical protein